MVKYFEIIDPLYPIVNKREMYVEYEHFWSLSDEDRCKYEPDLLALQFVLYAYATQYLALQSPTESINTAEFYRGCLTS